MAKIIKITSKGADFAPVDDFVWFQGDLKTLPDENYQKLKRLIVKLGFSEPISIWFNEKDEKCILNGHQRVLTLKKMRDEGYQIPFIPYSVVEAKNEAEAKQKVLSLASDFGVMSEQGLVNFAAVNNIEMGAIQQQFAFALDYERVNELAPTKEVEVSSHTRTIGKDDDEEEIITTPATTKIKVGDIYQLGRHRLMCGDSTNVDTVKTLLDGQVMDLVFTDPPYGINESGDREGRYGKKSIMKKGATYKDFADDTINYAVEAFKICADLKIKLQVWWGANYYCHHLPQTANWLVWDKRVDGYQTDLNSDCELAWVQDGRKSVRIFRHLWKGLIKASEHGQARVHPTQKPVALAEWVLHKYADAKNVLDLFGGSGMTLIACENLERDCFMMEIDPHYAQVIIDRWEGATGRKATKLKAPAAVKVVRRPKK